MAGARCGWDGLRALGRLVPARLRRAVVDRFFYAVFHTTRVTNDAYGWRPDAETTGDDH